MVEKASEGIGQVALDSLNLDELHEKMKSIDIPSVMDGVYSAVNEKQLNVSRKIISEIEGKVTISRNEKEAQVRLSSEDVEKLAYRFGMIAGEKVADSVDGMTMEMDGRPFGRIIKEALE